MASVPQRRVPQRQTPAEPSQEDSTHSSSPTSQSIDSSTLFLDNPKSSKADQKDADQSKTANQPVDSTEPRKCWICFSDETEDTPQNHNTWRAPCPCALTAHESCLLDWIADIEAPQSGRSAGQQKEIKCPQCKADIHLARPHNMVVDLVGKVEKSTGRLLLPTVIGGAMYTLIIASSYHGAHSIRMIFGPYDADAILAPPLFVSPVVRQLQATVPFLARPFFRGWRGWRVEFGLPLIPAALIASRTHLADTMLPILPILFFATQPEEVSQLRQSFWPPTAGLSFVVLPYIRGIYQEYMERVWGEREKAWMKEIHPRLGGEERPDNENGHNGAAGDDEEADMVQLEIEIQEEEVVEADDEQAATPPPDFDGQRAPPLDQPPVGRAEDQEAGNDNAQNGEGQQQQGGQQQDGQNQANGQPHQHRVDLNILTYTRDFAETTVGALLFPAVSAAMGEVLRYTLPPAWTMMTRKGWRSPAPAALLQTRWGRSIVGGCLFVVMKDAVRVYCRWKMAQSFRKRRVLDYDKSLGRVVG